MSQVSKKEISGITAVESIKEISFETFHTTGQGETFGWSVYTLSSFPVIHKVGNVDIFVLCKFKNMTDREIYYIN